MLTRAVDFFGDGSRLFAQGRHINKCWDIFSDFAHGTKGSAIFTGDKLTAWDVKDDVGEPAPVVKEVMSGSSDPMAISLTPFERQFRDFGEACKTGRKPQVAGEDGLRAIEFVLGVYKSCREGQKVVLG